jgi:hypothetical protein
MRRRSFSNAKPHRATTYVTIISTVSSPLKLIPVTVSASTTPSHRGHNLPSDLPTMLSRHGNKQPPQPLPALSGLRAPSSEASGKGKICAFCRTHVFNSNLYLRLSSARKDTDKSTESEYCRPTKELCDSVLCGCSWCSILARGILTAAHLDYWDERWNASHSDGSPSEDFPDDEGCEPSEADKRGEERDMCEPERTDSQPDIENELTLTLSDFEDAPGQLSVLLRFIKDEETLNYSGIEALIGVSWENPPELSRLKDVDDVHMSFELFKKVEAGEANSRLGLSTVF